MWYKREIDGNDRYLELNRQGAAPVYRRGGGFLGQEIESWHVRGHEERPQRLAVQHRLSQSAAHDGIGYQQSGGADILSWKGRRGWYCVGDDE